MNIQKLANKTRLLYTILAEQSFSESFDNDPPELIIKVKSKGYYFGEFIPHKWEIRVFLFEHINSERNTITEIADTLAHELVHAWQLMNGDIKMKHNKKFWNKLKDIVNEYQ